MNIPVRSVHIPVKAFSFLGYIIEANLNPSDPNLLN